jgi:hypothetical protein
MGYRMKRLQDFARGVRASGELLERERWLRERLERLQQQRLAELVGHAAAHWPFWRERLPRGRVELSELPVPHEERVDGALRRPRDRSAPAARRPA